MAHFLPPEHVRQVNKLEWPKGNSYFNHGLEDAFLGKFWSKLPNGQNSSEKSLPVQKADFRRTICPKEVKNIQYILEIDILRNSFLKNMGVLEGDFFRDWVYK